MVYSDRIPEVQFLERILVIDHVAPPEFRGHASSRCLCSWSYIRSVYLLDLQGPEPEVPGTALETTGVRNVAIVAVHAGCVLAGHSGL